MVDKKIYINELIVSDKWSPNPDEFGLKDKKWIAEIEVELTNSKSIKIGDLCWFFICSSALNIEELKSFEVFDIQNKYIFQDRLDLNAASKVIKEKLDSVNNNIDEAGAFLFFD